MARGQSAEAAAAAATRAAQERQSQTAQSQTQPTDAKGAALAQGIVPPDTTLVVRNGVPALVRNNTSAQLAAATVASSANDPGALLASGRLPEGMTLTPALSADVAKRVNRGEPLGSAIAAATAKANAPVSTGPETLAGRLASGAVDPAALAQLAPGMNVQQFNKSLGNALQRGLSPTEAITQIAARSSPPAGQPSVAVTNNE
jgi:hypothetical protein